MILSKQFLVSQKVEHFIQINDQICLITFAWFSCYWSLCEEESRIRHAEVNLEAVTHIRSVKKEDLFQIVQVSITMILVLNRQNESPHYVGLVVSVSASHAVVNRFVPQTIHSKDHHQIGRKCLLAWHACIKVGIDDAAPLSKRRGIVLNCLWGHALKEIP